MHEESFRKNEEHTGHATQWIKTQLCYRNWRASESLNKREIKSRHALGDSVPDR